MGDKKFTDEATSFAFCILVGEGVQARHRMYMLAADSSEQRAAWIRLVGSVRDTLNSVLPMVK